MTHLDPSCLAANIAWTRRLREQITGQRSRAMRAWQGLTLTQKTVLLTAAGINPQYASLQWMEFSRHEWQQIRSGLRYLRQIHEGFRGCLYTDFKKRRGQ